MSKQKQIAVWKQIKETAGNERLLAQQLLSAATRLESAADTALQMLGTNSGRARKGDGLSDDDKLGLLSSLTRGANQPASLTN